MKLTEKNAKFAVVATAFHGGGVISYHNSLAEAIKAERKATSPCCLCGCCKVVPITRAARKELDYVRPLTTPDTPYLAEIDCYTGNEPYWMLAK